ncbi:unnamed protein product [Ceratitis capitata]|uniref:(Mediterranean fruit fly) hypothetical protein n=1 Tax=Ceratitis capitata TaxID=7213 RepID=A0A811U0G9_CERCA|nr:unnamed protein product [Ceratitis capitata]
MIFDYNNFHTKPKTKPEQLTTSSMTKTNYRKNNSQTLGKSVVIPKRQWMSWLKAMAGKKAKGRAIAAGDRPMRQEQWITSDCTAGKV